MLYIYTYIVKNNKKISGDICRQHQQIMHIYIYMYVLKSVELFSVVIPACDFWHVWTLFHVSCRLPVIQVIAAAVTLAVVLFGLIKALISRAAAEYLALRCF